VCKATPVARVLASHYEGNRTALQKESPFRHDHNKKTPSEERRIIAARAIKYLYSSCKNTKPSKMMIKTTSSVEAEEEGLPLAPQ